MNWAQTSFETLYATPSKNGLNRPARVRGSGYKMINMGEIFAYDRIGNIDMELVPMNARELSTMLVAPGDLLFARQSLVLAGAGKCALVAEVKEPTTFESHIIRVRLKREVADPAFYHYYFKSPICPIRSIVTQGVQAGIRANDLKILRVHFPPIAEQRRIASILSAYDDLIENNRRRIALLEEAARLLYREWFVHFRFPGHESVKITDGIPEAWERIPASDVFEVNPRTDRNDEGTITYVPMAALSEVGMTIDQTLFEMRPKATGVRFRNGDTLLARITPSLENGKTGFVQFLRDNAVACGSTEFIVLRGHRVSNWFVYLTTRQADFRENAIRSMIGSSGRQRVQASCFDRYHIAVPPRALAKLFDEAVGNLFEQVANLDLQNEKLSQARDLLLPRLMSGEIAV